MGGASASTGWAIVLAGVGVMVCGLVSPDWRPRLVIGLFPLLVAWELLATGNRIVGAAQLGSSDRYGALYRIDLEAFADPAGAAAFLRSRNGESPARFFGYDPRLQKVEHGARALYRYHFGDPRAIDLLVNNRATLLRLPDIQGMNPIQLQRYADYVAVLNAGSQDYHGGNVLERGLTSPLLDLLNARYVVVSAVIPGNRPDFDLLVSDWPTVYRDDRVHVLANPEALPRVWIVHEARQVAPGASLALLADGNLDPRRIALLEQPPPPLGSPADPNSEQAGITHYEPDLIRLEVRTEAPGLLVLSEVFYPAWTAYVDGKPATLYVADHLLRAVAVGEGAHTIELRYEDPALRVGLIISGGTALILMAAIMGAAYQARVAGRHDDAAATTQLRRGPFPANARSSGAARITGNEVDAHVPGQRPHRRPVHLAQGERSEGEDVGASRHQRVEPAQVLDDQHVVAKQPLMRGGRGVDRRIDVERVDRDERHTRRDQAGRQIGRDVRMAEVAVVSPPAIPAGANDDEAAGSQVIGRHRQRLDADRRVFRSFRGVDDDSQPDEPFRRETPNPRTRSPEVLRRVDVRSAVAPR